MVLSGGRVPVSLDSRFSLRLIRPKPVADEALWRKKPEGMTDFREIGEELLARVRALLRRGAVSGPVVLTVADLRLDPARREVIRGDKRIDLTPKEYALLEFMLRRREQVLSRPIIAQHVWGVNYDTFTNVIDVYVNYLRKKIDNGHSIKLIHSVRGVGYVLKEEQSV